MECEGDDGAKRDRPEQGEKCEGDFHGVRAQKNPPLWRVGVSGFVFVGGVARGSMRQRVFGCPGFLGRFKSIPSTRSGEIYSRSLAM